MNFQITKFDGMIVIKIKVLGIEAKFLTMDEATEFVQSVIKNITSF
jgi:hypothetical protein